VTPVSFRTRLSTWWPVHTSHSAPTHGFNSNNNPSFQPPFDPYQRFINSYEELHFTPLFSTSFGLTALLYYEEDISGGCATGFSIMRPTIELLLDKLLEAGEAAERMAEAYSQAHAEDMKEDGNDNVDMPYDECNTACWTGLPPPPLPPCCLNKPRTFS
jgi:GATA-binding protein